MKNSDGRAAVRTPHAFAPLEFHTVGVDGMRVAGRSDWCAYAVPALLVDEPDEVCGRYEDAQVHRPAVCVDCGHRHLLAGPCADHGWQDECRYEAGAGCPMGKGMSPAETARWLPHTFVSAGMAGEVCGLPVADGVCGRSAAWWPHRWEEPGWAPVGSARCLRPSCHRYGRLAVFGGVQICGPGHEVDPGLLAGGGVALEGVVDPREAPGSVWCGLSSQGIGHPAHGLCPGR